MSRRFLWNGLPAQVFQKTVFQWQGDQVVIPNLYDDLSALGWDQFLQIKYGLPPLPSDKDDIAKHADDIIAERFALLDSSPPIRERYFSAPDPLALFGLPTSAAAEHLLGFPDPVPVWTVLRTQRAAFRLWPDDSRDVPPGTIGVIPLLGDLAYFGIVPNWARDPEPLRSAPDEGLVRG